MKTSQYNIFFEDDGRYFLYNTLTTGFCELEEGVYRKIAANSLMDIQEEIILGLFDGGYLVDDHTDEVSQYKAFYDSTRWGMRARTLLIGLVPTYGCNLSCPYCLQGEEKSPKKMSAEQLLAVSAFVENRVLKSQQEVPIDSVHVELYGGEPLLCKDHIIAFCNFIDELSKRLHFKTKFTMTSNFVLLDDDIIELIGRHHIIVQVTVDGTREQHDSRRIQHDGRGTYAQIIDNLRKMNEHGLRDCLTIRINVDRENIDGVRETLKELRKYTDSIYFSYTELFSGKNDHYKKSCIKRECHTMITTKILNESLRSYGMAVPKLFGKRGPCTLNECNKFFIDCYMDVYNCELLIKHRDLRIGVLNSHGAIRYDSQYYSFLNHTPLLFKKCRECKMLPNCAGGCPVKGRLQGLTTETCTPFCELSERNLVEYLKDYIRNRKDF